LHVIPKVKGKYQKKLVRQLFIIYRETTMAWEVITRARVPVQKADCRREKQKSSHVIELSRNFRITYCRGRYAPSTIAADDHPQAARRAAPHNQRMQQTIPSASKLASGLAPDPQRVRLTSIQPTVNE
jgi:hypothetical protein